MAHTLKIKRFAAVVHPEGDFIDVSVEISDGEKEPVLKNYGYPLGTPMEQIRADLKNVVAGLDQDAESQAVYAEREAKLRQVDEMRDEMEGEEIAANVSE